MKTEKLTQKEIKSSALELVKELNISPELPELYDEILKAINYYVDLPEEAKKLLTLWILGTHFYKKFPSYPILFFNAMKGSGKTRTLTLASHLSEGLKGFVENSISESALFRSNGALFLDEMERLNQKDKNNLNLLLNSCYKKNAQVSRTTKKKVEGIETYMPEHFDLYRPVALANINGLDSILEDRALIILLERSADSIITSRIEDFDYRLSALKTKLRALNRDMSDVCDMSDAIFNIINGWNDYLDSISENCVTNVTASQNKGKNENFELSASPSNVTTSPFLNIYAKIYEKKISGRTLEITLPLMIIASQISESIFEEALDIFSKIAKRRRENEFDSLEVLIYQFVTSLELELSDFKTPTELFNQFQSFVNFPLELNVRGFSKILERLQLISDRKRTNTSRLLKLNIEKAKQKIGLFEGAL